MTEMIEYGLSVSLEASPRTPTTPRGNANDAADVCYAPPRKPSFARLMALTEADVEDYEREDSEDEPTTTTTREVSISPRVLFTERSGSSGSSGSRSGVMIRRNLIADFLNLDTSLSPVSFGTSTSVRNVAAAAASTAEKPESIGECGVCYSQLPLRSNHVFTLCAHLFCLRCVLKWWDNATTCPICRAELLEQEDASVNAAESDDTMNENELITSNNDEIWMRRDFWNDRVPHLIETDAAVAAAATAAHAHAHTESSNDESSSIATTPSISPSHSPTRLTRYLYQDVEWNWIEEPQYDDLILPTLNPSEIEGLRENREIAMTLFARMRFREILFDSGTHVASSDVVAAPAEPVHFTGVTNGAFIRKEDWTRIMYFQRSLWRSNSYHSVMYEFVIRRTSELSPVYEVNIFGFIKDVIIRRVADTDVDAAAAVGASAFDDFDTNWQDIHEYTFVADVFTPTDFYLRTYGNSVRSYGSYNMEEGTITTQEVEIPFSDVRRIYRICGHERS